jgi:hypothetical protein
MNEKAVKLNGNKVTNCDRSLERKYLVHLEIFTLNRKELHKCKI